MSLSTLSRRTLTVAVFIIKRNACVQQVVRAASSCRIVLPPYVLLSSLCFKRVEQTQQYRRVRVDVEGTAPHHCTQQQHQHPSVPLQFHVQFDVSTDAQESQISTNRFDEAREGAINVLFHSK